MIAWLKQKALTFIIILWALVIVLQFILFGAFLDLLSSLFLLALLFAYSKLEAIEAWLKGLKT